MEHLSKSQQLIFETEKYAGGAVNVICGVMLTRGEKEITAMKVAVNKLFHLHDVLRTHIIEVNGEVYQSIADYVPQEVKVLQFENKEKLDQYADSYAKVPFDFHGSLCEIQIVLLGDCSGILVKLHHIVGDAWTLALIGTQFNALLNKELPTVYPYKEHLVKEDEYLRGDGYLKDRAFFLEQFRKCEEVTYFSERQNTSFEAARKTFEIAPEQAKQIYRYVKDKSVSPFAMFLAVFAIYMSRVRQNAEKFYVGTAFLNRFGVRDKNTVGMFVNTVPLLMELDYEKTFSENLSIIKAKAFSALRHQRCSYSDTLTAIRQEYHFKEKLYDVMLSYQNATIAGAEGEESTWYHCGAQMESLQIHIDDRDQKGVFCIHYDYQTEKFTAEQIEHMHENLLILLFDAIENDRKKLWNLEVLSASEKQKLLCAFNDTAVDYPRDKCVHEIFEEQAKKTPDKAAVIACDRTVSYKELNEDANRIAHNLIDRGVKQGDIVAFALQRKSYLIATIFGILKAGAAYLPVDTEYPQDRIDFMLEDSRACFFLSDKDILEMLTNDYIDNPAVTISNNSICYCIYTSGSSGRPKGVVIKHRNVINFCCNNRTNLNISLIENCDCILAINSILFDITVQEIHLPLLNSKIVFLTKSSLWISNTEVHRIIEFQYRFALITTPTKMSGLLMQQDMSLLLEKCWIVMIGAEPLPTAIYQKVKQMTIDAKIFNGYGPTETTCGSCYKQITGMDITIGKPIANTQIYIVDKYLCPVPIGVTGELCIAGDGVGAGYLNRPELTAEKFIDNPFGEGKLYKTGDLAYWREDGNIVYVGRNDFQVKIRGLRIELGEIENVISGVDGVLQSAVVVRKDNTGRQFICAFYTLVKSEDVVDPGKIDINESDVLTEIKQMISDKLPRYMMPHIFTKINTMPMTPSGKIDRRALPEVDLHSYMSEAEYSRPESRLEKKLAAIMERVLEYAPIGRRDDFFSLGGDSLKAIEFVSKAHNAGIYFSLQNVFDCPTVEMLGACITNGDQSAVRYSKMIESDFSEINKILAKNTGEDCIVPHAREVGNILLAGATGFLGIHILAEYLDHASGTAYCIVRGLNQEVSEQRLKDLLAFYFGDKYHAAFCADNVQTTVSSGRIVVICGDLQKLNLGLSEKRYHELSKKVDMVINAAASVKHYGAYQYFYESNVKTVQHLIAFCQAADAKLIHISTLSVSGNSFGDDFDGYVSETEKHFYESSLYIGQPLENVYARSKFEAEKAVLSAMEEGLQANIMRMGNLTNRFSDGVFQKNHESNATLQRIKGILDLGVIPDYLMDIYVEFTPIDEAARAVMAIARHFSAEQTVFHINSTKVIYMKPLQEYIAELGYPLKIVSGSEFTAALRKTAESSGREYIFETFINDMDNNDQIVYESNIHIENSFTEQYLRRLGFVWSEIGMEYLRKYTTYFEKIGYFNKRPKIEEKV